VVYSPIFTDLPVLVIIPHLFGTTVFHEVAWPLAAYVYAWELPMRHIYRRALFEVISESTKQDLISRGIPQEKIGVVYCGLDHERYKTGPGKEPSKPPYILYLGRIKRYKRIDLIVEAFIEIRKQVENVRLVVAGEGDYLGALESKCRELGLGEVVEFTGRVSREKKIRLLRGATMAMHTSEKEGWGMTNVEAQACGCPVVATASPGLRESVVDGKTGFLVRDQDRGALVDRAVEILRDPALRQTLSEEGMRWVKKFGWEESANGTLELIERICSEHGR
jgi:glycosyltransferase involved in cell wall biosynthesis